MTLVCISSYDELFVSAERDIVTRSCCKKKVCVTFELSGILSYNIFEDCEKFIMVQYITLLLSNLQCESYQKFLLITSQFGLIIA